MLAILDDPNVGNIASLKEFGDGFDSSIIGEIAEVGGVGGLIRKFLGKIVADGMVACRHSAINFCRLWSLSCIKNEHTSVSVTVVATTIRTLSAEATIGGREGLGACLQSVSVSDPMRLAQRGPGHDCVENGLRTIGVLNFVGPRATTTVGCVDCVSLYNSQLLMVRLGMEGNSPGSLMNSLSVNF